MISLIIIGSITGVVVGIAITVGAFVWRARAEPAAKQIAAMAASSRRSST